MGDDAAGTFEDNHTFETRREFAGGAKAVILHVRRLDAEQGGRFAGVWRKYERQAGERVFSLFCLKSRIDAGVYRNGIERIGVDDQGSVQRQQPQKRCGADFARTHADGKGRHAVVLGQEPGIAHHDFRVQDVERRAVFVEYAQIHFARPHVQCGARGQHGGTHHALGTTHNADIAVAALV